MSGERDQRVANLMSQPVGHGANQAQVGRFDLQLLELLGLRAVFHHEQSRFGQIAGRAAIDRHDADLKNRPRRFRRLKAERSDGGAGLEHLVNFAPQRRGKISELHVAGAAPRASEIVPRALVGVKNLQIAIDHYTGIAQLTQHTGQQFAVAGHLVVPPDIAHRQGQAFQQMKDRFQFHVGEWFTRDPPIEQRHPEHGFAVQDRHGHLSPQNLKLFLDFLINNGRRLIAAQNSAGTSQISTDSALVREVHMIDQFVGQPHCVGRAHSPAGSFG